MKALLTVAVSVIALTSFGVAFAASESAMQACYDRHAQIMEKPAVKNVWDCWRTHGHLMQKS